MSGFKKAKGEQAYLKMGMYGPAGSGKTFTALLIAEGLSKHCKKKIAYVDTERGTDFYAQTVKERKIHPDAFDFDALYTKSITEILENIKALDENIYGVLVLDSMTHIWEATKNSYEGRTTKIGTIPLQAWGKIKKPYRDLVAFLLSSNMHVIICGRQGNDFKEDEETGELKSAGVKMKAEGETAYEPHILLRLECIKGKNIDSYPIAHVEKDRTGILAGQAIEWPKYENIALPLLGVLGNKQARIETEDEVSIQDAEKLLEAEKHKEKESKDLLEYYTARYKLAKNKTEIDTITKEITKELKAKMLASDVTTLKEEWENSINKLERK